MRDFWAPLLLTALLIFTLGFSVGQSADLGWGLPLGTSIALFIAITSLFVTFHHSYSVRRHNRLLVQPHVILSSQFKSQAVDDCLTYQLRAKNVGLGPAIINRYFVSLDGSGALDSHSVFEEWVKLVNRVTPAKGRASCRAEFLFNEHAVDKGEEKILLEVTFPRENLSFMEGRGIAKNLSTKIEVTIDYKSHYGIPLRAIKEVHEKIQHPQQ